MEGPVRVVLDIMEVEGYELLKPERKIPVSGGAGYQATAAIGNGIVEEGIATYSIGTSGVIYAAANEIKYDPAGRVNSFCHAAPGKWRVLAVINSAAGSYQWYLDNLFLMQIVFLRQEF